MSRIRESVEYLMQQEKENVRRIDDAPGSPGGRMDIENQVLPEQDKTELILTDQYGRVVCRSPDVCSI